MQDAPLSTPHTDSSNTVDVEFPSHGGAPVEPARLRSGEVHRIPGKWRVLC